MVTIRNQCYVVGTAEEIPLHLKDRSPFVFENTEMSLRFPRGEVFGTDGQVKMVGAIEFQTKISPGTLSNICDPDELFTHEMANTHRFRCVYDPAFQRGIKDTPKGPKEYLQEKQIESMMRDIEENRFECPQLMWNLRADETVWAYINNTRELRIYQGVSTRPDTNHRHHAIVRFHRRYQRWVAQTGSEKMGAYNPVRQYGLVIYTDDYQGEAHRSYVYNALGWKVSNSTASYLESKTQSPNLHVKLARELMERSVILGHENVEILKNNLSRHSAKMISFNMLGHALRDAFPDLTDELYPDVLNQLVRFVETLNKIRPNEIALLDTSRRKRARETSVADSPPLWSAYFRIAERIIDGKFPGWEEKLRLLNTEHTSDGFTGDLFSPLNPDWVEHKVVVMGAKGPQVRSNPQARRGAWELLGKILGIAPSPAPAGEKPAKHALRTEEKTLQQRLMKDLSRIPAAPSGPPVSPAAEKRPPSAGDYGTASPGHAVSSRAPGQEKTQTGIRTGATRPNQAEAPRVQNHKLFEEKKKSLEKLNTAAPGAKK